MAPLPIAILLDKERSKIGRVPMGRRAKTEVGSGSWFGSAKPRQKENASERKCPANGV
jgi:hypothetical protein